ncbi:hypothetical protein [Bifidobacterium pseudocatenulatum]|uniref:hypothetical protein n=1 Tax=Bifidobacterium pseudocatenulatum TaxID=28026 RepID=UPI001F0F47BB|nr:hypothetical protein [Bifidobacterium pseudocatenulatum]MCH4844700.1 hypothetical protein [Bifidobacterium pseudocatenulatum]
MERIETIDLKAETDALEAGHGITLYTFDEYDRLMHYAHIVASTPKERADGYSGYFLTIFKGGGDMRRFEPDDGDDYPDLESTLASVKTIWPDTPIWWEHDGSVPGVDDGITFDELRGADMLAAARRRLENEMRPRGIEPDGEQAVKDAQTIRQAGLDAITPSFFELFEDYIAEEDSQLAADDVELVARTAWMREMYRTMLRTMKN